MTPKRRDGNELVAKCEACEAPIARKDLPAHRFIKLGLFCDACLRKATPPLPGRGGDA